MALLNVYIQEQDGQCVRWTWVPHCDVNSQFKGVIYLSTNGVFPKKRKPFGNLLSEKVLISKSNSKLCKKTPPSHTHTHVLNIFEPHPGVHISTLVIRSMKHPKNPKKAWRPKFHGLGRKRPSPSRLSVPGFEFGFAENVGQQAKAQRIACGKIRFVVSPQILGSTPGLVPRLHFF